MADLKRKAENEMDGVEHKKVAKLGNDAWFCVMMDKRFPSGNPSQDDEFIKIVKAQPVRWFKTKHKALQFTIQGSLLSLRRALKELEETDWKCLFNSVQDVQDRLSKLAGVPISFDAQTFHLAPGTLDAASETNLEKVSKELREMLDEAGPTNEQDPKHFPGFSVIQERQALRGDHVFVVYEKAELGTIMENYEGPYEDEEDGYDMEIELFDRIFTTESEAIQYCIVNNSQLVDEDGERLQESAGDLKHAGKHAGLTLSTEEAREVFKLRQCTNEYLVSFTAVLEALAKFIFEKVLKKGHPSNVMLKKLVEEDEDLKPLSDHLKRAGHYGICVNGVADQVSASFHPDFTERVEVLVTCVGKELAGKSVNKQSESLAEDVVSAVLPSTIKDRAMTEAVQAFSAVLPSTIKDRAMTEAVQALERFRSSTSPSKDWHVQLSDIFCMEVPAEFRGLSVPEEFLVCLDEGALKEVLKIQQAQINAISSPGTASSYRVVPVQDSFTIEEAQLHVDSSY